MISRSSTVALSLIALAAFAPCHADAQLPDAVEIQVPKAPTAARVGDTVAALGYELQITNLTTAPIALTGIEVLDAKIGGVLLTVADSALIDDLNRAGSDISRRERATLAPGLHAVVFLWLALPNRLAPTSIYHRLSFRAPSVDTLLHRVAGGRVEVARTVAIIGPPLAGEWVAAGGPSNSSAHRRSMITLDGRTTIAQRYAIDFVQVDERGQSYRADVAGPLRNSSFYAWGAEVLSVADGIVVEASDSIPENEPGMNSRAVPITLQTLTGNTIVVDIGRGRFALYAHLQPHSVRVRVGDHVRRGQVLGLVGNSGNSTQPHLHFQLTDALAPGTSTMGAEGIPYEYEALEVQGSCVLASPMICSRTVTPSMSRAMPAENQIVRFPALAHDGKHPSLWQTRRLPGAGEALNAYRRSAVDSAGRRPSNER